MVVTEGHDLAFYLSPGLLLSGVSSSRRASSRWDSRWPLLPELIARGSVQVGVGCPVVLHWSHPTQVDSQEQLHEPLFRQLLPEASQPQGQLAPGGLGMAC